jgi:UDP-glucose 4-epimerase
MNPAGIQRAFVTGGAGFIGSHIVDRLAQDGAHITVYDNFSTGQEEFLSQHGANPRVRIVRADVLEGERLKKEMAGCDFVFHFQANADVRGGIHLTRVDLEQNTIATWNVLEAMRVNNIGRIAFASSATVYGEPNVFPTPESYAPHQTSLYGASKLAGEALIQAYSEYFAITCYIFRFVSWIGARYTHGVIFDFMEKLRVDKETLEILGDGKQRKSYLDVVDGTDGIFYSIQHAKERKNLFNLGHDEVMNVLDLAEIVVHELGLKRVRYRTTGGERGWLGDAPFVHLDTTKLKALGWRPQVSIAQGIRNSVRYLQLHPRVLDKRASARSTRNPAIIPAIRSSVRFADK